MSNLMPKIHNKGIILESMFQFTLIWATFQLIQHPLYSSSLVRQQLETGKLKSLRLKPGIQIGEYKFLNCERKSFT